MPTIPTKDVLIKELNNLNQQTLSATDLRIGLPTVSNNPAQTDLNLSGVNSLSTAGIAKVTYQQLDLTQLSATFPKNIKLLKASSIATLLPRLSREVGVTLNPVDFSDGTVTWGSDSTVTFSLQPLASCRTFKGNVSVTVSGTLLNLNDWVKTFVLRPAEPFKNNETIFQELSSANQFLFEPGVISYGAVRDNDSTDLNTVMTLTGIEANGYTGSVDVFFHRVSLSEKYPDLFAYVPAGYTGTTRSYVTQFLPNLLSDLSVNDLVDTPVSIGAANSSFTVTLQAVQGALTITGSVQTQALTFPATSKVNVRNAFAQTAVPEFNGAAVRQVSGYYLTKVEYGVNAKQAFAQYMTQEYNGAAVKQVSGFYLTTFLSGINAKQVFEQYVVAEYNGAAVKQVAGFVLVKSSS